MKSLFLLLLLATGCATSRVGSHLEGSQPEYLTWNAKISGGEKQWSDEAERRLHVKPIVVVCHGGVENGEWWMYPDEPMKPARVRDVAQTLHAVYPGRYILLICCNQGQVKLNVPGVWYCRKYNAVWSKPWPNLSLSPIDCMWHTYAGNIDDFEEGK